MHEMSLALETCRLVELQIGIDRLPDVVTVGLEIGTEAGIEVNNFTFCLETLLAHPPFGRAEPVVTRVGGDVMRLDYLEVDDGSPEN